MVKVVLKLESGMKMSLTHRVKELDKFKQMYVELALDNKILNVIEKTNIT
jgi:hypothetical protein